MNGVGDDSRNDEGELVKRPISITIPDLTDCEGTLAYIEWTLATSSKKKRRLLARLNGIQKALCNGSNHSLSILEKKFLNEYHQTLHLEEEFLGFKIEN